MADKQPNARLTPLAKLRPAPWNPRTIRDDRFKNLCDSIEADPEFIWRRPVLAQADGTIYAGNMRYRAAEHLGMAAVPAIVEDIPDRLAKERALRDNAQWGDWDDGELARLVAELQDAESNMDLLGLEEAELKRLLAPPKVELTDPDAVPPVPDEPTTKPGDLWLMGEHRLLCGDAKRDIATLIDGPLDAVITDPPYGINVVKVHNGRATVGGAKPFGKTRGEARSSIAVKNYFAPMTGDDEPFEPAPLLGLAPLVILWGANNYADKLPASSGWICWDKREVDMEKNNFADCELAWTNKDGRARMFRHLWMGLHKGSERGIAREHPTQKPIALFDWLLAEFTEEGATILDPFLGSGTTLIACERLGRRCYAIEIEPRYVDVAVRRWEEFTGRKAVLDAAPD